MIKDLAYIIGVMNGDGYINWGSKNPAICLETTNKEFGYDFAEAIRDVGLIPYITKRVRVFNHSLVVLKK